MVKLKSLTSRTSIQDIHKLAVQHADQGHSRYLQRASRRQLAASTKLTSYGTYGGYDAASGLHSIQTVDGGTLKAESITNAGLRLGDSVSVSRPVGRAFAIFKAIPR